MLTHLSVEDLPDHLMTQLKQHYDVDLSMYGDDQSKLPNDVFNQLTSKSFKHMKPGTQEIVKVSPTTYQPVIENAAILEKYTLRGIFNESQRTAKLWSVQVVEIEVDASSVQVSTTTP